MKNLLSCSFLRTLAEGSAGLFDIFGQRAPRVRLGTFADDLESLRSDFRAVGNDFESVLSKQGAGMISLACSPSTGAATAQHLTMIEAANFAKTMAGRLIGDVQSLTVDEIELDDSSREWLVSLSFRLPPPAPKRGVAVISPVPLRRETRVLRVGTRKPAGLISMKAKSPVGAGGGG